MKITAIFFRTRLVVIFAMFFIIIRLGNYVNAQETFPLLPESLIEGFKNGDASKIADSFRETLSLELQNQNGVFSKTQSEKLLQEFFLKNKVDNFTVLQSGNTGSAENIFAIGELGCGQNHYRVYLVRSKLNNQYLIHSLSITKI